MRSSPLISFRGHSSKICYASGDLGLNLYWQGANYYLLYYYTDVLGIQPLTAGFILTIGGLLDAVTDPVAGVAVERTQSRFGRYRFYLLAGSLPLGLAFALLFSPPLLATSGIVAIAVVTSLLFRVAYTVVAVPYSALGAVLTHESNERSILSGFRMLGGFCGGLLIVGIVTFLTRIMPESTAFATAAVTAGILGTIALLVTFASTADGATPTVVHGTPARLETFVLFLRKNTAFLILIVAVGLFTMGAVFTQATLLYRFQSVIGNRQAGDIALLLMAGAPILGIPLWSTISVRIGKKATWSWASATMIAGLVTLALGREMPVAVSFLACTLVGASISGLAVLQWALLPDTIEFGQFRSGFRLDAVLIGVATSIQKLSAAVTSLLAGVLVEAT